LMRLPPLRSTHSPVCAVTKCRSPAISLSEPSIILARLLLDLYCHYLNSWAQKFSLFSVCVFPTFIVTWIGSWFNDFCAFISTRNLWWILKLLLLKSIFQPVMLRPLL
jgi:hypothetical protein